MPQSRESKCRQAPCSCSMPENIYPSVKVHVCVCVYAQVSIGIYIHAYMYACVYMCLHIRRRLAWELTAFLLQNAMDRKAADACECKVLAASLPKGPCTYIVYTWALKGLPYSSFRAQIYTIWVHGPLGPPP